MKTLKEIAAILDCHPRTAKKWWKKMNIPPDVPGHGPHRWEDETAARFIQRYKDYFKSRGTTPQICRLKYAGDLTDPHQILLFPITPKFHASKTQTAKATSANGNPRKQVHSR
jgi:hypothetical protein